MSTQRMMMRLTPPLQPSAEDPRLDSPSFHRNGPPIIDALRARLDPPKDETRQPACGGQALEIGGGTGQHVALLALSFPEWRFWPSDPNPGHRASIDAWRAHLGLETVHPAIDLDIAAPRWPEDAPAPDRRFGAMFCANVIHIAPWPVGEGLFRGAAAWLAETGFLALYGPFRWHGRHISGGNEAFDADLRRRDPRWGVRDIDEIDSLASACGLRRTDALALPANNHLLIFERRAP